MSEDEITEGLSLVREVDVLKRVLLDALGQTVKHNLLDKYSQPLCDYFFSDTKELICSSFLDISSSQVWKNKEFLIKFHKLNTAIFQLHIDELSRKFVQEELNAKAELETVVSPTNGSLLESENMGISANEIVIDLKQVAIANLLDDNGHLPENITTVLLKLDNEMSVRLYTHFGIESRLNSILKETDAKIASLNEKVDHFANETQKLTVEVNETRQVPVGKWLPEKGDGEAPLSTKDMYWRGGNFFDKKGQKWFVSAKHVVHWARSQKPDTFRKMIYHVFTPEKIHSFMHRKYYPANMEMAIAELFDWVGKYIHLNNEKLQIPSSEDVQKTALSSKLRIFYQNFRGRQNVTLADIDANEENEDILIDDVPVTTQEHSRKRTPIKRNVSSISRGKHNSTGNSRSTQPKRPPIKSTFSSFSGGKQNSSTNLRLTQRKRRSSIDSNESSFSSFTNDVETHSPSSSTISRSTQKKRSSIDLNESFFSKKSIGAKSLTDSKFAAIKPITSPKFQDLSSSPSSEDD